MTAVVGLILALPAAADTAAAHESRLPAWVYNPPADTATVMYGLGEGGTIAAAKDSALNDIAGRLETKVSSIDNSYASRADDAVETQYEQNIKTSVSDITITGYDLARTYRSGDRSFVLVELKIPKLIRDMRLHLRQYEDDARNAMGHGRARMRQYRQCKESLRAEGRVQSLAQALAAVDLSFDAKRELSRYHELRSACADLIDKTKIFIKVQPSLAAAAEHIESALHTVVHSPRAADAILIISGRHNVAEMFGAFVAQVDMRIAVQDVSGRQIAANTYQYSGSSVIDGDSAVNNAIENFFSENAVAKLLDGVGL